MPLPVIGNVYRTAVLWNNAAISRSAVNVLHFRGAPGSAAGLYTAIDANVTAAMWAFQSIDTFIDRIHITPLDGTSATVENKTSVNAKWNGTGASGGIPQQAALLKLRTAKRGPSYRGRVYLPWVAEDTTNVGTLTPGLVTSVTTAWTTFRTAVAAAGYTLVIASYKLQTAELVTTAVIEGLAGTQRRRMEKLRR